jgi:GNAT superfamily N-acetyltransferase
MIRKCTPHDTAEIFEIINDAAVAYEGKIPEDRYHVPYMPVKNLVSEIGDGVVFYGVTHEEQLAAVMGIQDRGEVTLIRHAYTRTELQGSGFGGKLLKHLLSLTEKPILIGTWKSATWAIRFYKKFGFKPVTEKEKDRLLKLYWNIPERQIETSVVLARTET